MKLSMLAGLLMLSAGTALAQGSPNVAVKDAWVRATVPAQKATGAFMELTAPAGARLVEARSPAANVVEIHEMAMEDNVMKMRAIPGLDLPPGRAVELKPGGYHVMLIDLKQQVKAGDSIPLTLVFEDKNKKRESVDVKATARPINTPAKAMEHGKKH